MRNLKKAIVFLLVFILPFVSTGCWNYREINEMAIVTALAIDKDQSCGKFNIAVEIIRAQHGDRGGTISSNIYKSTGATIFEAVRDLIPVLGRKAFWSHTKVVIISKQIAESNLSPVLDWLYRDQEIRRNMEVLISQEPTAEEILNSQPELDNVLGYNLDSAMKNRENTNRFPEINIGDIATDFSYEEKSDLIPLVKKDDKGENRAIIWGSAILKGERVVGYLSGEDTFNALWLQGKLKKGTFIIKSLEKQGASTTIEIFRNNTKIKVKGDESNTKIVVNISTDIALAEMTKRIPFAKEEDQKTLKMDIEKEIEKRLTNTVKKVQDEDKADIFYFSRKVKIHEPKYYKKVSNDWGEVFSRIPVEVNVDIHINGSAVASKHITGGD